jgi:hypothetical protein
MYKRIILLLAIFGVLATIWGICLAYSSIEKRDLVYAVNPIPSIVVSGQTCHVHGIAVSYGGEELGCVDITIAQIAILNKGKKSIEQADFLQDGVYIQTFPASKVLDAQVVKVSRKQTEFKVIAPSDSWEDGRVPLNWRILEENDGAVIQLIYLGSPEVELSLIANIEEISKVRRSDWKTWTSNTTEWPEF